MWDGEGELALQPGKARGPALDICVDVLVDAVEPALVRNAVESQVRRRPAGAVSQWQGGLHAAYLK